MIAVRTNNLIGDMFAHNLRICAAIFAVQRGPSSRPSTVPVETRRQAIVPRSAPGPVLEVMLKNWPIDRMVKEIVELRAAQVKAANDHDDVALEVVDREYAKLAGLAEQHDLRDAGFSKRMWERVDELTTKAEMDKVNPDVFHVVHGSFEPGTLGAELAPELRRALFEITQPQVDVPQAEATPSAPALDDADEVVRKAMEELANNQQSSI